MTLFRPIRWSDRDHFVGPFTFCLSDYKRLAFVFGSGDGDDYPGCRLRVSVGSFTGILALPPILRPWREKVEARWDAETIKRLGRDWYWNCYEREYGFSYSEGFLQVFLGRQTHDSSTTQSWSKHLPWSQWRHVRHSLYGLTGEHYADAPTRMRLGDGHADTWWTTQENCPSRSFAFADYDGEQLTAKTRIEEREWRFGDGWFKWLSVFRKPKIVRSLDITFSGETGKRKGSWKGGTIGHSIQMQSGEFHESAFRRYCAEHSMTFVNPTPN